MVTIVPYPVRYCTSTGQRNCGTRTSTVRQHRALRWGEISGEISMPDGVDQAWMTAALVQVRITGTRIVHLYRLVDPARTPAYISDVLLRHNTYVPYNTESRSRHHRGQVPTSAGAQRPMACARTVWVGTVPVTSHALREAMLLPCETGKRREARLTSYFCSENFLFVIITDLTPTKIIVLG